MFRLITACKTAPLFPTIRFLALHVSLSISILGLIPAIAHGQGVSVPDPAVPVSLAPSIGTTQVFALNANGTVTGTTSSMSSSFALNCAAASGFQAPTSSTPIALDDTNRILYLSGPSTSGSLAAVGIGVPYSGSNCRKTPLVTLAGSTALLTTVDSRHNRALFLTTMGSGGPDVLSSYNTANVGDFTLVGNMVKEVQTSLGSGGRYTAMVADGDGLGLVAITELRTDTSNGGLWIYSPGLGKAFKVLGPDGKDLPAVNAFILPNPKNNNGSLLVLANQDNLTTSNITSPPQANTVFTIIDLGQLLDLVSSSTTATTVTLPFVDTISNGMSAYAIFGAAYNSVDRKLYALVGGGTSQTDTFRKVVRYDPYSLTDRGETAVANISDVNLDAFSLPVVTLNAAARTMQILTSNPSIVYSVDLSGNTSTASAASVPSSTFSDPNYSPTAIATNPLAGETYIASSSGYVDVLMLPAGAKAAGFIDLTAPLSVSSSADGTDIPADIRLLSAFPISDASLSTTDITVTATAASTGQSFTFAKVRASSTKDLPHYITGTFPTPDTYTLVASFPGDATYSAFTSAKAVIAVGTSPFPTTLSATAVGSGTSGTAAVTLSGSTYAPTGLIRIKDAQTGATLSTYSLPGGAIRNPLSIPFTYTTSTSAIIAVYAGDSKNGASTSAAAQITTTTKIGTSLTLTAPSAATTGVPFSATVSLNPSGTAPGTAPTGNIVIYGIQSGSTSLTPLGQISVTGAYQASAQVAVTIPAAGTWSIAASYAGDTNFEASTSANRSVTAGAPGISVNPSSLSFVTAVNTTDAQDITVQNTGNVTLNISGISAFGTGYSATGNCPQTLAAGATCIVHVTFTPTAAGTSAGHVAINSDAPGSTSLSIPLTGATPTTGLTVSPQTLTFNTISATTSAYQNVTLTNTGNTAISISAITLSNPAFSQLNGCPASLAAAAQCVIRVNFSPAALTSYSGQLNIVDSAPGSPHTVSITGNGVVPVSLTASTTSFAGQVIGTASISRPVITLANNTTSAISVTLINLDDSTNFERNSTTCGTTLAANSVCSFPVEFHPTTAGAKTLNVLVTTSASTALKVTLTGTGLAAGQCADADGDKLCDDWEQNGVWVRVGGGEQFVDLPAMGASASHKDIFLHIDWMATATGVAGAHSHQPFASAMKTTVTSFANAPVSNPDGKTGINLHIDCGPSCFTGTGSITGTQSKAVQLPELSSLDPTPYNKSTGAFSWATFDQNSTVFASTGRNLVFHHVIFAHDQHPGYSSSGISRNSPLAILFSQGASDLIVSLGSWVNSTGTSNQQAGTLMHELGHNLGLQHGGQDGNNYKPTYISIMNYLFQTTGVIVNGAQGLFDYSENALPQFSENPLNEITGLAYSATTYPAVGPLPAINKVGTSWYCPGSSPTTSAPKSVAYMNGSINWDCDTGGVLSAKVAADVNADAQIALYNSFADWPAINYGGGAVGGFGSSNPVVDSSPSDTYTQDQESLTMPLTRVTITSPGTLQTAPGSTTTLRFVVASTGSLPDNYTLTASSDAGWVNATVTPATLSLASGASSEVTVRYTVPAGAANGASDRIVLTAQSQNYSIVNDSAQAIAYATSTPDPLAVSVAKVDFGTQATGGTSNSRSLVITNTGTSALSFPTITASTEFTQSNTCTGNLAAGASCVVTVNFKPSATGTRTGTLSVVSSASSTPTVVALQGTSVAPELPRPTVTLAVTPSASSTGKAVALTVTVVAPSGTTKPTGSVTILNGTTAIGQATLDATGNAVITTSTLPAGKYDLLATYNGDSVFSSMNAPIQSLTITDPLTSSITLSASAASVVPGVSVTFTATVPTSSGASLPTGTVRFLDGATVLGNVALNSTGVATYSTSTLAIGSHSVTAVYSGDVIYMPSTSAATTVNVTNLATTVTLASSASTAIFGTAITFTATATASGATPTGTVTLLDGTATLGTATLNASGVAAYTTSTLAIGNHSITAQYAANGTFLGSVSTARAITVTGSPDFSISSQPSSLTVKSGSSGSATFTVTPVNGYAGTLQLSCSMPANATCSFAPASLTFTAASQSPQTSVLTINAAQHASVSPMVMPGSAPRATTSLAAILWLPGLLLLAAKGRKLRSATRAFHLFSITLLLAAAASVALLSGCGSNGNPTNTPVGTYNINVVITDGTTNHTLSYPVIVN